jgi:predicted Fe-Mo cluster-binding NifX family protein
MQTQNIRKIAIAQNEGCVSPVLDFAQKVLIVEIDGTAVKKQEAISCEESSGGMLPAFLSKKCIDTVICGAISRPLLELIQLQGIEVIPYVTGKVSDVIDGFFSKKLLTAQFRMPGCWPGARRGRKNACKCRHRFGQVKG